MINNYLTDSLKLEREDGSTVELALTNIFGSDVVDLVIVENGQVVGGGFVLRITDKGYVRLHGGIRARGVVTNRKTGKIKIQKDPKRD